MTDRETLRLAPPVIFWWVWVVFVAVNVTDYTVQGLPSARFGAVLAAVLLLGTGLALTLALLPKVVVSDDGITVVNPYRTHFVPWRRVTFVDTGEWVRVHYAPGPEGTGAGRGFAAGPRGEVTGAEASSAAGRTVHCWGLYVSVRARRKIASGPPRPRSQSRLPGRGLGRGWGARLAVGDGPGSAPDYPSARLPEEARYLASLPPAKAMAVRLDTRADREQARAGDGENPPPATARWSWPALAAVALPAVILLAVAFA